MRKFSDEELLQKLKSINTRDNDDAFSELYREMFPKVLNYVQKNRGGFDQAEDIFQEALMAFFKMARRDRLPQEIKVEAYFFTIAKNLWLKQLNKRKAISELSEKEHAIGEQDYGIQAIFTDERRALLELLMKKLGERCYQVLTLYYFEKNSMKEIAQIMGFASSDVSKNRKSDCLKKLKSIVLDTPQYKSYFR